MKNNLIFVFFYDDNDKFLNIKHNLDSYYLFKIIFLLAFILIIFLFLYFI